MIVTFYGTETSKNYAPQLLSAIAFETAFGLSRKTLVLQFYQKFPVETLLIGKQQVIGERDTGFSDDTGIETLIRKTRSKGLKDEDFTTYTKQILSYQKSENNFDVATVARLADFKKEVLENAEVVKELIDTASHIYNSIFILADGKDEKLIHMLHDITEKAVVCVEQGNKQNVFCPTDKTIYLIPNYDERSFYNTKYLCKLYNVKQMFAIPYNVAFNDACKSNNILKYLYENNDKQDSQNGSFVYRLKEIAAHIAGTSVKDMNSGLIAWDFKKLMEQKMQERLEKMSLNPEQVDIQIEKKHFWSRKKQVIHIASEPLGHKQSAIDSHTSDKEMLDENSNELATLSKVELRKIKRAEKKAEKAQQKAEKANKKVSLLNHADAFNASKRAETEEYTEYEYEHDDSPNNDTKAEEVYVPVKIPKTKKATPTATKKAEPVPPKTTTKKATAAKTTQKETATEKKETKKTTSKTAEKKTVTKSSDVDSAKKNTTPKKTTVKKTATATKKSVSKETEAPVKKTVTKKTTATKNSSS